MLLERLRVSVSIHEMATTDALVADNSEVASDWKAT